MKSLAIAVSLLVLVATSTSAAEDFTGTKEVHLIHGDLGSPKAKTIVITDRAKIAKLVATIKLEKKEPVGLSGRTAMRDQDKTKEQVISELQALRGRVAAWQESEARADCLLQTVPLGVAECDTEGVITLVNPAYENMTGYSREELVGMRVADLVQDGPQREALSEYFQHLLLEQPAPSPYQCKDITKAGRLIDVQVDWAYKRDSQGHVVGFTSIISDITGRKRAEQALQASEERFRKVFEEGPIGVALVGLDTRIQHVNRRFCEMLGYSEDEILALGIQGITHPDDFELDQQLAMRVTRGEIPSYTIDKRYIRKDGKAIWGRLTVSMMHDADGTPTIGIGMIEDITDRKQAEQELAKSKAVLLAAIDCLPFNFFAIGLDGRYTLQNAVSKAQHGADVIGKRPEEVCPNEHDLAIWLDNNRRAFAGEKVEGEVALSLARQRGAILLQRHCSDSRRRGVVRHPRGQH